MAHEIIPQHLAIRSMRSSGYRDTAHALAELIDNSIQAGEEINACTQVEVICVDKTELVKERQRRRIDRIAVYDNACGMDAETLRIALQFGSPQSRRGDFERAGERDRCTIAGSRCDHATWQSSMRPANGDLTM